jgi:Right handed beta helix region
MPRTFRTARRIFSWGYPTTTGLRAHTAVVAVLVATACGRVGFDGVGPDDTGSCQIAADCRGGGECIDNTCTQPPADRSCATASAVSDSKAPVLLFTDLVSGPTRGGERDLGVFVTLYGLRFGEPDRVLVTYGGVPVARYVEVPERDVPARELETLVVQLGGALPDGPHDLVVTAGGRSSNPLPFTQRLGGIYFVDPKAAARGDGSFDTPWRDLYAARDAIRAGDTVYIHDGAITTIDPVAAALPNPELTNLLLEPQTARSGRPEAPIAYVGYPGPSPRIGGVDGGAASLHAIVLDKAITDIVLANLTFANTSDYALDMSGAGRRFVGNTLTKISPAFEQIVGYGASNVAVYGNHSFDNTRVLIWLVGSHDFDIGWNHLANNGGEGFRIGGFGDGDRISNAAVHDNLLESHAGPGIVVGDYGSIVSGFRAYNNVFWNVQGPPVLVIESTMFPQGDISIANNTFINARAFDLDRVVDTTANRFRLVNSVIDAAAGTAEYFVPGASFKSIAGDHNLYFGASATSPVFPPVDAARIVAPPGFVDYARGDLRLASGSPGLDTGIDTGACADYLGLTRPHGAGYDRGAFESP